MKLGRVTHVGIARESSLPDERPCTYMTVIDAASEMVQRTTTNRK